MLPDLTQLYSSLMNNFHDLTTPAALMSLFQVYFTISRAENE